LDIPAGLAACATPVAAARATIAAKTAAILCVCFVIMSPPFLGGRPVAAFADRTTSR
jgi:hypothetical protein